MDHESLAEFGMRTAQKTGWDSTSNSEEWLRTKANRIEAIAKAICHYGNGGSSLNSCCQRGYRCRSAAVLAAISYYGDGSPLPDDERDEPELSD